MARLPFIAAGCVVILSLAAGLFAPAGAQTPPINPTVTNCNITKPVTPVTPALLTSGLPCSPSFSPPFDLAGLQVTAFTIAHSLTLGLTMYGIVSLPSRIVEPLIALSIAYVAIENILTPWRPAVVFCFGLLHGMGFASALAELRLPREEIIPALISFNLGIEFAQLTVLAVAFLAIAVWIRDKWWYRPRFVVPASALIAAIGLFWTVQRVFWA
jgi:hypothetical protein